MNRFYKKMLNENITLLYKIHKLIRKCIDNRRFEDAFMGLQECQQSAIEMGNAVERCGKECTDVIEGLEEYCEEVYQVSQLMESEKRTFVLQKRLDHSLCKVIDIIDKKECKKVEIVFFPYKASMWTSLESIWYAAKNDVDCDVKVVPIPYYDLDAAGNKVELHYEGHLFPAEVEVIHYQDFSMEYFYADIIYFHNPYDEYNNLTRVPEMYYARNLKEHTGCLVYSPYAMESRTTGKYMLQLQMPGYQYANRIIVQNQKMAMLCKSAGIEEERLVVSGSPKLDGVVGLLKKKSEWQWKGQAPDNKFIFLLNIHLTYFTCREGDVYKMHLAVLHGILDIVEDDEEIVLLVRPHPLLKEWILKTYPSRYRDFDDILEKISKCDRCILDMTADYKNAFAFSNAMISTFSSLITEYMVTEKPILIIQNEIDPAEMQTDVVDYSGNYFRANRKAERILSVKEFVEMVKRQEDSRLERRKEIIKRDLLISGQGMGQEAHNIIKAQYIRGEI